MHLKGYNIELALATVTFNRDQLIQLLSGKVASLSLLSGKKKEESSRTHDQLACEADLAVSDNSHKVIADKNSLFRSMRERKNYFDSEE